MREESDWFENDLLRRERAASAPPCRGGDRSACRKSPPRQELELRGDRLGPMTASPMTHTNLPVWLAIAAGMEQREGSVATAEEATQRSVPARTVR